MNIATLRGVSLRPLEGGHFCLNRAIFNSKSEDETNLFCRSCIDLIRAQLDKPGRRRALTDHKIDSENYALKLEEASGKEPEDWNMECWACDRSLDYVSLPILGEEQTIVPELDPTVPVSRQAGDQMSYAVGRRSTQYKECRLTWNRACRCSLAQDAAPHLDRLSFPAPPAHRAGYKRRKKR